MIQNNREQKCTKTSKNTTCIQLSISNMIFNLKLFVNYIGTIIRDVVMLNIIMVSLQGLRRALLIQMCISFETHRPSWPQTCSCTDRTTRILEMLLLSGPLQTVVFPEPETQQSIDEAPGSDTDAHGHADGSH